MSEWLKCLHSEIISNQLDTLTLLVSIMTLGFAWFIPKKIMINQAYITLTAEYRSHEMGAAILAVFSFYRHDCQESISNIRGAYHKRYQKEIMQNPQFDPAKTLHFQRRRIAHFYSDMAALRYNYYLPRLSAKQLQHFFTPSETKLLSLILHMASPASEVFEEAENLTIPAEPPEEDAYMNKLLYRLYEETEEWI